MTDSLTHRGPDDLGYLLLDSRNGEFQLTQISYASEPRDVCLGHRRLSIIDLSPSGRQPMANDRRDTFVVFNGEIFNYLELRAELAAMGHAFRTHSDTEVILHAYEQWGAGCVQRFNGMWALSIWDQRKREMFCSRDRFGIKPFYYWLDESAFIFASEIKGILRALETRPGANRSVIGDFLIDGSLCRTADTFFEGIQRLLPAHNLTVSAEGARVSRYWNYPEAAPPCNEGEATERFQALLDDAVRLCLRSDVPVGIALSGGMDSSSILALASRTQHSQRLKAFTAVFPGQPYDESEYAELAARASGAELFCIDDRSPNLLDDLTRIIWTMDYPALDPQVLSRWRLMRLASEHVKVVLEGQGADEMLAGYPVRYFAPYLLDELGNRARGRGGVPLRDLAQACRTVHREYGNLAWYGLIRQLTPRNLSLRWLRRMQAKNQVFTPEFVRANPGRQEAIPDGIYGDRLTSMMHYDHATGILPMLLKFGDALSMSFSVESRLPFLDHRLVEFVFSIPPNRKLQGSLTKGILREAMAGVVPERILSRTDKVGFRTPVDRWIAEHMDSTIRPILLSKQCKERGIFDTRSLERVLERQISGKALLQNSIFRWLSLELWFRLFIDGEMLSPAPTTANDANTIR